MLLGGRGEGLGSARLEAPRGAEVRRSAAATSERTLRRPDIILRVDQHLPRSGRPWRLVHFVQNVNFLAPN